MKMLDFQVVVVMMIVHWMVQRLGVMSPDVLVGWLAGMDGVG